MSVPHPLFADAVRAISAGDVDALRALLDRAPELVEVKTEPPARATLLHYTSHNAFDEVNHTSPPTAPAIARLLLQRGAEADAMCFDSAHGTALCLALSSWFTFEGRVQNALVDAYLDGGASIEGVDGDGAPLGHAIGFGYTRAVEHLAARGAFVDHLTGAAALGDVSKIAAWRRADGSYAPEASRFARGTKKETGRFSWPPPSDPNFDALALVTAATHGRAELVIRLLDLDVDPSTSVSFDQTPLHFAAYIGHPRVVDILLAAGARTDIRERQFHRTPAEWAEETREHALAARIREHGE